MMRRHGRVGKRAPRGLLEVEAGAEADERSARRDLFVGDRPYGYRGRSRKRRRQGETIRLVAAARPGAGRGPAEMQQHQTDRQNQGVTKCRRKQAHTSNKRKLHRIASGAQNRPTAYTILNNFFKSKPQSKKPSPPGERPPRRGVIPWPALWRALPHG